MFFKERHRQHAYEQGFRDALVMGTPHPGLPEIGPPITERPGYMRGFRDGEQAVLRIERNIMQRVNEQVRA